MSEHDDLPQPAEPETAEATEAAPKRRKSTKTEPETVAYRVVKASIAPHGGARDAIVRPGEIVHLTKEQAKHYNMLGFLAPIIED
jgi:hypothetical protein